MSRSISPAWPSAVQPAVLSKAATNLACAFAVRAPSTLSPFAAAFA